MYLYDESVDHDAVSPVRLFGLYDEQEFKSMLLGLSARYPDFINATFTNDLRTISLHGKSSKEVLDLFDDEAQKSPYDGVDMDKLRTTFNEKTNRYIGKTITNKATGRSVVFSKTSQKDVRSHTDNSVINNGFTPYEHFEVANQVIELFQNATLENEHADTKNDDKNVLVERFLSQPVTLKSGKEVQACITVKHSLNPDGRRIYAIEAIEIKEALEKTRAKGRHPSLNKASPPSSEKSIPHPVKKSSRFPRLMVKKSVARQILRQEYPYARTH